MLRSQRQREAWSRAIACTLFIVKLQSIGIGAHSTALIVFCASMQSQAMVFLSFFALAPLKGFRLGSRGVWARQQQSKVDEGLHGRRKRYNNPRPSRNTPNPSSIPDPRPLWLRLCTVAIVRAEKNNRLAGYTRPRPLGRQTRHVLNKTEV